MGMPGCMRLYVTRVAKEQRCVDSFLTSVQGKGAHAKDFDCDAFFPTVDDKQFQTLGSM